MFRALAVLLFTSSILYGQGYSISGTVSSKNDPLPYANVILKGIKKGTLTNKEGAFKIENLPSGRYTIEVSFTGYKSTIQELNLSNKNIKINLSLDEFSSLDEVVITGSRTFKRKVDSPVIVNILNSTALENVQACNLSEGLKFQPGLRVETDCQTCNYTQLRMNGLGGGYSQILINGRPIFSPLTGMYGLEQIPVNMIERIETIRGGGSTLYGSSAIGGVVNVITKTPKENSFNVNSTYQNIKGSSDDYILN